MAIQELFKKVEKEIKELKVNPNNELEKRFHDEIVETYVIIRDCYHNQDNEGRVFIIDAQNKSAVLFNFTYRLSDKFGEQVNKIFLHLFELSRLVKISIYG